MPQSLATPPKGTEKVKVKFKDDPNDFSVVYYLPHSPVSYTLKSTPEYRLNPLNCMAALQPGRWLDDPLLLRRPPHCCLDFLGLVEVVEVPFYGLAGEASVHNSAFEKEVFIHYSFDHWSTKDVSVAEYCSGLTSLKIDKFGFHIPIPDCEFNEGAGSEMRTIEVAIEYRVNGMVYWDNFHAQNYKFTMSRNIIAPPVPNSVSKPIAIPTCSKAKAMDRRVRYNYDRISRSLDSHENCLKGLGGPYSSSWHPKLGGELKGCLRKTPNRAFLEVPLVLRSDRRPSSPQIR